MKVVYCIDSSALIHAWTRTYPKMIFECVWDGFEDLVNDGRLVAPVEVEKELKAKTDGLHPWCHDASMFEEPSKDVIDALRDVMRAFPNLVDKKTGKNQADPWVVAHAIVGDAVVVTQEAPAPKGLAAKIPDVCKTFDVECIGLLDMFRREKWVFKKK
jgi:hypothetical protein